MKDITPLCLNCLKIKLSEDYANFGGRALVIGPAPNFPCYVFQPNSKWREFKLVEETSAFLSKMENTCRNCGAIAQFLWLTSDGLVESNSEKLFDAGISETLLRWGNNLPCSVCGRCCVELICKSMQSQRLTFVEVCGPHLEDGFVVPMGY